MATNLTPEQLREMKASMFAERDNIKEAYDYALSLVPKEQEAAMTTALLVYQNTMLEVLAQASEGKQHG